MPRESTYPANVDDPTWVIRKYEEAKELLLEIQADHQIGRAALEPDVCERIEDFRLETFMDRCTTMGIDCGCNRRPDGQEVSTEITDEMVQAGASALAIARDYDPNLIPSQLWGAAKARYERDARAVLEGVFADAGQKERNPDA